MKKFWEKVSIKKISSDSFCIMLDKRILKTPLKRDLVLPNLNLAQEIVKEWDQDSKKINTESMIFYGLISTSLDKIIDNKNLYINDILDYIDTDLICYRALNPKELVDDKNNSFWFINGERRISWAKDPPSNNPIIEGKWWNNDEKNKLQISLDHKVANDLKLKIGDSITFNILAFIIHLR